MKVNMALLGEEQEEEKPVLEEMPARKPKKQPEPEPEQDEDEEEPEEEPDEDDEDDQSDKHSKLKTALLVAMMLGGFVILVSNMMGLVNNMRLDNQGSATTSIVYEAQDKIDSFFDMGDDGSVTISVDDHKESEVPTDAARDGPEDEAEAPSYEDESSAIAAMRKQVDEANNYAALKEQELKNAEDMLDSSLQREADLQSQIDQLTGNN